MENKNIKVSLAQFEETAVNNGYEIFTADEVAGYYKEGIMKSRSGELSDNERESFVADIMYLQKAICVDSDGKDAVRYFRKSQVAWEQAEDGTIMKGLEGVYLDTPENRRLKRVGQAYTPTIDFLKSLTGSESNDDIMKSLGSGVYADTPDNQCLGRVGKPFVNKIPTE